MEGNEEPPPGTKVLELWYKVGANLGGFFVFHGNSLVINFSPLGVDIADGDQIAEWDHVDVRNMDYQTFKKKHLLKDVDKKKRIRVIIYRKGFDPADLNPNVPVRIQI